MTFHQHPACPKPNDPQSTYLMERSASIAPGKSTPRSLPFARYLPERDVTYEIGQLKSLNFKGHRNNNYELTTSQKKPHHHEICGEDSYSAHHQYSIRHEIERAVPDVRPKSGEPFEWGWTDMLSTSHPPKRSNAYRWSSRQETQQHDQAGISGTGGQFETALPGLDCSFASIPEDIFELDIHVDVLSPQNADQPVPSDTDQWKDRTAPVVSKEPSRSLDNMVINRLLRKAIASFDVGMAERMREVEEESSASQADEILDANVRREIEDKVLRAILLPLGGKWMTAKNRVNGRCVDTGSTNTSATRSTGRAIVSSSTSSGGNAPDGRQPQKHNGKNREDDQGSQDSGGRSPGDGKGATVAASEHHELGCHYNKLIPQKFCRGSEHGNKYQACAGSFKDIAALVQHFRERHYYSDKVCPRCHKQFGTKRSYGQHLRAEPICPLQEGQSIEDEMPLLPSSDRRQRLERVGKRRSGVSNEEQWCRIWNALFPGHPCPDPYRRLNSLERDYDRAVDMHIPGILYELVSTHPSLDIAAAEAHCRRLTEAIRNHLWPYFGGSGHSSLNVLATDGLPIARSLDNVEVPVASLTDASSWSTLPQDILARDGGSTAYTAPNNFWDIHAHPPTEYRDPYDAAAMHALYSHFNTGSGVSDVLNENESQPMYDLHGLSLHPYLDPDKHHAHSNPVPGFLQRPPHMVDLGDDTTGAAYGSGDGLSRFLRKDARHRDSRT